MIETTKLWEVIFGIEVSPAIKRELSREYGSKRSGTIYLVANNMAEAKEIVKELFTRNGFTPPANPYIVPTHLVKKALRMVF